jgi:hypothetical protein
MLLKGILEVSFYHFGFVILKMSIYLQGILNGPCVRVRPTVKNISRLGIVSFIALRNGEEILFKTARFSCLSHFLEARLGQLLYPCLAQAHGVGTLTQGSCVAVA